MTEYDQKAKPAERMAPPVPKEDPFRLPPPGRGMRFFSMAVFFALGAALTGILLLNPLGLPFLPDSGRSNGEARSQPAAVRPAAQEDFYQCPMHPEVLQTEPGDCPVCGMALVRVDRADGSGSHPSEQAGAVDHTGVLRIDPVQVQNMGVVSEPVRRLDLAHLIRTVGILDFNADNVSWVNMKYSGWIEKVHVNYVGQKVVKGKPLFEIYSPELVTTQEEYLSALEYRDSIAGSRQPEILRQAENLLDSAAQRLAYWDVSAAQIEQLERTRQGTRTVTVNSPVEGVVVAVMEQALEGIFVKPGMNLYKIADLSSIWVHADIYESDLGWIHEKQQAEVELSYFPGETFGGEVLYLYPELNEKTRTVKICVELANPQGRLRPGMYANVKIRGEALEDVVAVPDSAILRSGERNVVFVDLGDGRYRAQEIELGVRGEDNLIEVRSGLTGGERVVVQAQFMLDSESRVQEAIRKLQLRNPREATAEPPPGHVH
jgi:Cu(I)/Ag(I) efflux system membrane fusion protein/cobalt-zinc-cadmium efflux system membrane fusion protein